METRIKLLFIEDDQVDQMAFERFVGRENLPYDYTIAASAAEAKKYLSAEKFDLVLCDYLLGDGTALDLLETIEETPTIIITGSGDEQVAVEAMKAGAVDYLIKDPQSNYLVTLPSTVESAIERKRDQDELARYRQQLEALVAERTAELEQANHQLQQEITQRRQAEDAEAEQKALLEAIYRNAPLVLMVVDAERRVQQVNGFATEFAGRPIEEMLGLRGGDALRCLHALDAPEGCGFGEYCQHCLIRNTVLDTLENGTNHLQVEAPFSLSKDGEINELTLLVSTTSLTMKDKRMALVTMQDITERKQAEEALRESERLLNATQQITHIGGWVWNVDEQTMYWTDEVYRIHGFDPQEIVPGSTEHIDRSIECYHPEDRPVILQAFKDCAQKGKDYDYEFPFTTVQGQEKWIRTIGKAQKENSRVVKVFGNIMDITERKKAEEALQESEEKFRSLFNQSPLGIYIHDLHGHIINVNPAACKQLRYTEKELLELSVFEFHPTNEESINLPNDEILKLWKSWKPGEGHTISAEHQRKDGSIFIAEISTSVVQFGERRVILALVQDITERKRAEEALEESNQRLFTVLNSIDAHIYAADMETYQILFLNEHMRADFGDDLVGKICWQEFRGESAPCAHCSNDKLVDADGKPTGVYIWQGQNPITKKWYLNHDRAVKWIDGRLVRLQIAIDITERVHAEQALRESEEQYRTLVNSTLQGVVIAQSDPVRLVFANPAMTEISGYSPEQLIGMEPDELVKLIFEEDRQRFFSNFQKRVQGESISQENEYRVETKDGTIKWVALYSSRIEYQNEPATLTTFMDITERKRAEEALQEYSERLEELVEERTQELRDAHEKLLRQERLAVLGQLAGSVSHELRNPLGVINNAIYYLKMKMSDSDEDIEKSLDLIDQETQNASKIIADLLDFGRIQSAQRTPVEISDVVSAVIRRNPPPAHVTVEVEVSENLPPAFVDGDQIRQVLANLVTNAYQAMSSSSSDGAPEGGQLSLESEQWAEDSVIIKVSDTGTGIPPKNLEKIFEPLFTTRARGIGLGLAICKKLVAANDGEITVESEVGEGTRFRIKLPIAKKEIETKEKG